MDKLGTNVRRKSVSTTGQNVTRSRFNSTTNKASTQNINRNPEVKKVLVRNTERPVPECRVFKSYTTHAQGEQSETKSVQAPEIVTKVETFDFPEPYSTISFSKKIESVIKCKKTRNCSDVDNKKIASDEKVSRKVNFPCNQPIYKDLIPLMCDRVQTSQFIASRNPLPQKDRELVLEDFITPKKMSNYYSLPSVELENKIYSSRNNNLRLYKLLQVNSS